MSTHDFFAPLFPLIGLRRSHDGAEEPIDPANDYYYPDGAYYYMEAADDQE